MKNSVRFLSIRVISDDAHDDLPREVAAIMNPSGATASERRSAASGGDHRASRISGGLYEHSIEAADRLSKFIMRCLDDCR